MDFHGFAGNSKIKQALKEAFERKTLSHAYIISGPQGSGKRTLANIIAASLVCSGNGNKPCTACKHCRKAAAGIHPDIKVISSGGREIVVGRIREELCADSWVKPNEAECKVYIIEHAQDMNFQAQNSLLALLEEPPGSTFILLLAENADALLKTVRSRCVELSTQSIPAAEALPAVKTMFPDESEERIIDALRVSGGIIGRAAELLRKEGASLFYKQAEQFLKILASGGELSLFEQSLSAEKLKREDFAAFVDAIVFMLHASLLKKESDTSASEKENLEYSLGKALNKAQLIKLIGLAEQIRLYCDYNAGVAHLAGMLGALSWEIRSRSERMEQSID